MAGNKLQMKKMNMNSLSDHKDMRIKHLEYLYDPHVLEDEIKRVFDIDKQNMELMKTLNLIIRNKGKTDCWRREIVNNSPMESQKTKKTKIIQENKELYKRIRTSSGAYSVADMERDWKRNRIVLKNKAKSNSSEYGDNVSSNKKHMILSKTRPPTILKEPKIKKYPQCFFELRINELKRKLGRIIIELYEDAVPKTCKNFIGLCMGVNGFSYKNTPLHRIISGYLCQGGDVTKFNGTGGMSIYEGDFENENFKLKHNSPGILSMYNLGNNTCNSKFNLTFKKLEVLDGKNVVFGKIVKGLPIIHNIESFGTKIGKPKKKIIITECGLC